MEDKVPLKEHIEAILAEKDKALAAALVAVKEESRKTEIAAEKRFDLLNELRQGVATKEQLEALEKIVNDLDRRAERSMGVTNGSDKTWQVIVTIIGVGIVLAGFIGLKQ